MGEQFIRGKNNIIKGHFGQVDKKYHQDKETKGFQFTLKGKDENKHPRARRSLKWVFRDLSVPLLLSGKISVGEIGIGENIVEMEYKKVVTNDGGNT